MKRKTVKLLSVVIVIAMVLSVSSAVFAINEAQTAEETVAYSNYDIIKEIALAYDRQGGQIPYDQLNARRNVYASPEDATEQRKVFLDCSSFVNVCYLEGFGVNVMPIEIEVGSTTTSPSTAYMDTYAKEHQGEPGVVGYWEIQNYPTKEEQKAELSKIYENLEIGDVIVYRHGKTEGTAGHAVMYFGDGKLIHCGGAGSFWIDKTDPALSHDDYEAETTRYGNTIAIIDASECFDESGSRYLFKKTSSDTVWSFSIYRPFERGLTPTEETLNRMKIAGLSMEKVSSVHENTIVNTGEEITYTVTLENTNAHTLSGVTITDTIPGGTVFVSGDDGVKADGQNISWIGDVEGNETVIVNYTVKVTETATGALIKSTETYVSGVKLGNITHVVSGYSKEQHALIGDTFIKYANEGREFSDGLELAKEAYKETFDVELTECTTVSEVLENTIDVPALSKRNDTQLSKMIPPNMYGGLDIKYGQLYLPEEEDRSRLPKKEHLAAGDIILAEHPDSTIVFLYAGGTTLVEVIDGKAKLRTIGKDIYTPKENALISLLAYNKYTVLRPSISVAAPAYDVASISVTTAPEKVNYDACEYFDPKGMVVTATMTDGTTKEIYGYSFDNKPLESQQNFVTITFGNLTTNVNITVSENKKTVSVSEIADLPLGTPVTVEGVVVGVMLEGLKDDDELLIKDLNNDSIISVQNIPYGSYPDYGYKKGDRITLYATVKRDTSATCSFTFKKCLEFSKYNGDIESTITSSGNEITYNLDNVVEINTWEDMQKVFVKGEIAPYTYVKISPESYVYPHTDEYGGFISTLTYKFHKNSEAKKTADLNASGSISVGLHDDSMKFILGENWKNLLFGKEEKGYPGTPVHKGFTAVYTGGQKSFFQLVILDESWIDNDIFYIANAEGNVAEVNIPRAGDYAVSFVEYQDGVMEKVTISSITVTGENKGELTITAKEGVTLASGDNILLWNTDTSELCAKYKVK